MTAQLDEMDVAKLRQVLNRMADFIALFETTEEKMRDREQTLQNNMTSCERFVNSQLEKVQTVIRDFQSIMTETGAARWRVAAEGALKEGKDHLKEIQKVTNEFLGQTRDTCERLDRATSYTVKSISQAVSTFDPEEIRQLTNESTAQIKQSCNSTLQRVTNIIRWFHWKNLGMVLTMTLIVTMVTGLYLNDEWPWETHYQVKQQRTLAKAVTVAWPELTASDKNNIIHSLPAANLT